MVRFILAAQLAAIAMLFAGTLYIACRRPSKMQLLLLVTAVCTMLMLIGYTVELTAADQASAMLGAGMSYIGKPFALLALFLFTADYCKVHIPRYLSLIFFVFNTIFPLSVFFNDSLHLFYSTVDFDRSRIFSPLILGHGPLYYVYAAKVIINFALLLFITVREFRRSRDHESRIRLIFIFGTLASSILGYLLFVSIPSLRYDTTIAGAFLGILFLSILFFRYRLFDVLTLAKEDALWDANVGVLVLDNRNQIDYANRVMTYLLEKTFRLEEFSALPFSKIQVQKGEYVYEVKRTNVVDEGWVFGKRIEIADVTERFRYTQNLEREVESRTAEIRKIQRSVVSSFAGIVEARDSTTGQHIMRMGSYVQLLAESLRSLGYYPDQLTDTFISDLVSVAPLHDIGKISIPDSILCKPGSLTREEFAVIKTHTVEGARVIDECLSGVERESYVALAKEVALSHHEKWDGSGYPQALRGREIPISARIIAVADVYDAIRSERPYKPVMSKEEAYQEIIKGKGSHFAPELVEAFENARAEIEAASEA